METYITVAQQHTVFTCWNPSTLSITHGFCAEVCSRKYQAKQIG